MAGDNRSTTFEQGNDSPNLISRLPELFTDEKLQKALLFAGQAMTQPMGQGESMAGRLFSALAVGQSAYDMMHQNEAEAAYRDQKVRQEAEQFDSNEKTAQLNRDATGQLMDIRGKQEGRAAAAEGRIVEAWPFELQGIKLRNEATKAQTGLARAQTGSVAAGTEGQKITNNLARDKYEFITAASPEDRRRIYGVDPVGQQTQYDALYRMLKTANPTATDQQLAQKVLDMQGDARVNEPQILAKALADWKMTPEGMKATPEQEQAFLAQYRGLIGLSPASSVGGAAPNIPSSAAAAGAPKTFAGTDKALELFNKAGQLKGADQKTLARMRGDMDKAFAEGRQITVSVTFKDGAKGVAKVNPDGTVELVASPVKPEMNMP